LYVYGYDIMKCPQCGNEETKVIDSRLSNEGRAIRRRRSCLDCEGRFTTYEKVESYAFSIKKKDGRIEPYQRDKVLKSMRIACLKRPITVEQIENLAYFIERQIQDGGERTLSSCDLGDMVMSALQKLDKVAYVRFASVYKEFKDPMEFKKAIESLSHV
jgi:transcriptional repressor NrdR